MKPEICVRITGTRTGKLRARVDETLHDAFKVVMKNGVPTRETPFRSRYEVTVGGDKWANLPEELRSKIYVRACAYVKHLTDQLDSAKPSDAT